MGIVKLMGDGAIVEFGSVVDAVICAVGIQRAVAEQQVAAPAASRVVFRIGVNLGDVVVEGEFGDRSFATFDDMHENHLAGEKWITGEIADQAQLKGVIASIADLGVALRSFSSVADDPVVAGQRSHARRPGPRARQWRA